MATSPLNTQILYHTRSNSFPSRPHPLTSQFDEHLSRLQSSDAASTSSSSSISHKLNSLQDLYDCMDKLLELHLTQQALAQEQHKKWVSELLDGSLRLLDVCSIAKDSLLQTKECAQELQSILRRRKGGENELASEVRKYLASRKAVKKAINKALGNFKGMESKCSKDHETESIINMLGETEAITFSVFESLLSLISGHRSQSKLNGWSLVSKLVHPKRIASEDMETDINEFVKVDVALESIVGHKTSKFNNIKQVENLQSQLKNLELCIQDLEDGLECLCRRLIKTRVAQLNILNH